MDFIPIELHELLATHFLDIHSVYHLAHTCKQYNTLYTEAYWTKHKEPGFTETVIHIGIAPLLKRLIQETGYKPDLKALLASIRDESLMETTLMYTTSPELIAEAFNDKYVREMQVLGAVFHNEWFIQNIERFAMHGIQKSPPNAFPRKIWRLITCGKSCDWLKPYTDKGKVIMRECISNMSYFSIFMIELLILLDDEELVNDLITYFVSQGYSPKVIIGKAWSTGVLNIKRFNFTAKFIAGHTGRFQRTSICSELGPYITGRCLYIAAPYRIIAVYRYFQYIKQMPSVQ